MSNLEPTSARFSWNVPRNCYQQKYVIYSRELFHLTVHIKTRQRVRSSARARPPDRSVLYNIYTPQMVSKSTSYKDEEDSPVSIVRRSRTDAPSSTNKTLSIKKGISLPPPTINCSTVVDDPLSIPAVFDYILSGSRE